MKLFICLYISICLYNTPLSTRNEKSFMIFPFGHDIQKNSIGT